MKTFTEKEEKLNSSLKRLKNLNLINPSQNQETKHLKDQKNQLEIEKQNIEKKYKTLVDEYENLSIKLRDLENKEKMEEKKRLEFSEKIDELNQETNTLMDEIDKWQT